ncbi:hypothetical protein GUJ93_ZPchr0005g15889 [Zizania palustris]|uniref:Uncharacterized protein n=1 Tax=Zizania palustris TaxID=103762 RepID=A0A8J5S4E9_ZIZPA|nr:hypothetical protein GUJ93_ZPchr0005g15889 [Zizania palustris]
MGAGNDMISTTRLLSGREVNYSGNEKFSSIDRAFVLGRYLPVDGPEIVDRMDSRAYVSQFSADGSLFVTGFQVYSSLAPIIHIVNVGAVAKESYANVTDIHDGLDFSQHEASDVNTVAFADDTGHLIYSGSDDTLCKVA